MNTRDRHGWMWAEAYELLTQAERLHRQFFRLGRAASTVAWEPPIDLFEDGAQLQLTVALPGVSPEQVALHVYDGGVSIEAIRPRSLRANTANVHRLEIPYGRFARRVNLPPGTYELQEQLFRNGCLNLRFLKRG